MIPVIAFRNGLNADGGQLHYKISVPNTVILFKTKRLGPSKNISLTRKVYRRDFKISVLKQNFIFGHFPWRVSMYYVCFHFKDCESKCAYACTHVLRNITSLNKKCAVYTWKCPCLLLGKVLTNFFFKASHWSLITQNGQITSAFHQIRIVIYPVAVTTYTVVKQGHFYWLIQTVIYPVLNFQTAFTLHEWSKLNESDFHNTSWLCLWGVKSIFLPKMVCFVWKINK